MCRKRCVTLAPSMAAARTDRRDHRSVKRERGLPSNGITLLAGLQRRSRPICTRRPPSTAASVTQRFPAQSRCRSLKPVLIIVTNVLGDLHVSDFQLPYVLTHGGPAKRHHLFATHAFDVGMSAASSAWGRRRRSRMLPALAILIVGLTLYLRP